MAHLALNINVISKYTITTSFASLSKPDFKEGLIEVDPPECHGAHDPSLPTISEPSEETCQDGFNQS